MDESWSGVLSGMDEDRKQKLYRALIAARKELSDDVYLEWSGQNTSEKFGALFVNFKDKWRELKVSRGQLKEAFEHLLKQEFEKEQY